MQIVISANLDGNRLSQPLMSKNPLLTQIAPNGVYSSSNNSLESKQEYVRE